MVAEPNMSAEQTIVAKNGVVIGDKPQRNTFASRWRVYLTGLGGVLIFYCGWHWGHPGMLRWSLPLGMGVAVAGLLIRIWATGWLCKNAELATRGPYAFTRNPLYLGTCLIALGQSLMTGLPLAPLLFPALCVLLYWPTMREEQEYLLARYGGEYAAYQARVPLLFPRLWPARGATANADATFSWPRVTRCYKGFIANALVILIYFWIQSK